jgi:DNA-binding MarR family transcriptional regulator
MALIKKRTDDLTEAASAIRRSVVRLVRRMRLERADEALSLFTLSILGILYQEGAVTATGLARRERVQPQSLTRVLASLEKKGFVSRQRDGTDGRRLLITLTSEGKRALGADVRRKEAWLAKEMERALAPDERGLLLRASRLLDRLTEEG